MGPEFSLDTAKDDLAYRRSFPRRLDFEVAVSFVGDVNRRPHKSIITYLCHVPLRRGIARCSRSRAAKGSVLIAAIESPS